MGLRPRVLVVDADSAAQDLLASVLGRCAYHVSRALTGAEGLEQLTDAPPDALLLDLDLPDVDGAGLLVDVRKVFERPIVVVTGRSDIDDKVRALDLGADDYVLKPFDPAELLARLRAAIRNGLVRQGASPTVRVGAIEIDLQRRTVRREAREVALSTREYSLLAELAKANGKVITHRQLLMAIWGPERVERVEYLRVFVQQLRRKLEQDASVPRLILTESGVGYRLGM
jgi:two-component system KDP operon response regulator KdpE